MKAHVKPGWHLSDDQRLDLEGKVLVIEQLLTSGREVDETTPEFIALLDAWEACHVPSPAQPTVKAYRTHGGSWLTGGVDDVLAALCWHVGDTSKALEAYKRHLGAP